MLRASCLTLEIKEFRCFEVEIQEIKEGRLLAFYCDLKTTQFLYNRCSLILRLSPHGNQALKMNRGVIWYQLGAPKITCWRFDWMLQLSSGWKWRNYFPSWSWYQISIYAGANWEAIESIEKLCGGRRMKLYGRRILWGWAEFPPPLQAVCLPSFCLFISYLQYKSCSVLDDLRTLWGQGWAIEVSPPPVCLRFDWLSDDDIVW